jgi:ABC-type multidrug transport system fused ATPase/permease subunit
MTDLWIDILLAILVTVATVMADWLANLLVSSTRRLAKIRRVTEQAISEEEKLAEIRKELERFYAARLSALIWGSDLSAIALSLDLAVLGVWVTSPTFFPFFSRWSSPGASREIPVWLILLFTHFVLLLVSIALKHLHGDTIESIPVPQLARFLRKRWFSQNKHMLASNALGFFSLLSSFVVITNAI